MKTLIVYDSLHGNTEKIALAIGDSLSGGNDVKIIKADGVSLMDIKGIGLLIVGSPTHGGRFTEPIKVFFDTLIYGALQGVKTAAFDTSVPADNYGFIIRKLIRFFGNAAQRIAKVLIKKGATLIGRETFFVLDTKGPIKAGEIDRAGEWAAGLMK